jgi:adenylate cyclase, class 2
VALETEIKIRLSDYEEWKVRLLELHPRLLEERHLEDNLVLDFPDRRLRSQSCLLRVRKTKNKDSVTFKGPPHVSAVFKTRDEFETTLENGNTLLAIFEKIGLRIWFRYQKYREEYGVPAGGAKSEMVKVALDATPIGDFAELEGSEEGIRMVGAILGIHESQYLRESYHALFLRFCRERGEEPGHMVFS